MPVEKTRNMPVLHVKACYATCIDVSFFLSSCLDRISQQSHKSRPTRGWRGPFNSKFFGADRHIRRGGRGAEWSGDACVAHGGQVRSGRGTGHRATQGPPLRTPS